MRSPSNPAPSPAAAVEPPAGLAPAVPLYDSAVRPSPLVEELVELWRYRDLIVQLVRRDVVARYKRSVLGVLWTLLNPIGTMVILAVVFSHAFAGQRAYPAYVLCGLLAWNFLSQTTLSAMRQLVAAGGLLRRIYVPRTVFAAAAVGTGLVNLVLGLVPLLGIMLVSGVAIRPSVLAVPLAILTLAAVALGVGLALSVLAVYFNDAAELYTMLIPALFYLTPIIYPVGILPASVRRWLVTANPIHHLVSLFRTPLYEGHLPDPLTVTVGLGSALIALVTGWAIFTARADHIANRI